ncbi:MAG: hypothetical protein ACOZAN_01360, partial [Patescibacteria group bacterium]
PILKLVFDVSKSGYTCRFEKVMGYLAVALNRRFSNCFGYLSSRIKEYSKKNKAYKWTLQMQDRDGNWYDNGTMGLLNLNFWTKTEIKYLQNDLLPKELLYEVDEAKD